MGRAEGGTRRLGKVRSRVTIPVVENHRLVQLADRLDWEEMEVQAQFIRASKLKNAAGRPPQLRALLGALVLRATRKMTYREEEDLIRNYAPARYLCALIESDWTPDHDTIHDFVMLMGEDGIRLINEHVVKVAVAEKLADPSVVVGDTTAQEAAIPYPNEMRLLAAFMTSVAAASKRGGHLLQQFIRGTATKFAEARRRVREYRLFAKTKERRQKVLGQMVQLVTHVQGKLSLALNGPGPSRVTGHGKVARAKAVHLHQTMAKLLPQIRYWMRTGKVAAGKVINLHLPRLYSIVRGKIGKPVEFGLSWGIRRLRGGFLLATVANHKKDLVDARFAVSAVDEHIALFGKAPKAYAYDRAGHSKNNVALLRAKGVKKIGLAPRGKTSWEIGDADREELVAERAQIEGSIGTIKSNKYGFNKPAARSEEMMGACGQLAVLGLNLNKLVRGLSAREELDLTG